MCGIAGIVGIKPELAKPAASVLLQKLKHRGPDDHGIEEIGITPNALPPAFAIHSRLSILDPSTAGHQPMSYTEAPSTAWIVFNGLIYNFKELRGDLKRLGHHFTTGTDTEVILHAYQEWDIQCVSKFNGMFSLALFDTQKKTVWLARDRLGIKPLYYYRPEQGGIVFSSELRAIMALDPKLVDKKINRAAVESFLSQGAVWGYESILKHCRLLEPGNIIRLSWLGSPQETRKYWSLNQAQQKKPPIKSRSEAVTQVHELLVDSVKRRLVADVPLGIFLSGGVDSGALATLATLSHPDVRTICIGFDDPRFDESEQAAKIAKLLGTKHSKILLTGEDLVSNLDLVLNAMDQPTVDGFNTFFVSRAAKEAGLKVALSGLGGDELFGGYATFHDVPKAVRWLKRVQPFRFMKSATGVMANRFNRRSFVKLNEVWDRKPQDVDLYLLRREMFLRKERVAINQDAQHALGLSEEIIQNLLSSASNDPFSRISHLELSGFMRNMLLRDADVFSMANGLEIRTPFLDHRLVELVLGLPGEWKFSKEQTKALLVEACLPKLPKPCYQGKKQGFTFPWDSWLRGPAKSIALSRIQDRKTWENLNFHFPSVEAIWKSFCQRSPRVTALQIVALVVLADYSSKHQLGT